MNFDVVTDIFLQQLVSENIAVLETIINTCKIFLVLLWYLLNSYPFKLCSVIDVQNVENMIPVFGRSSVFQASQTV